MLELGKTILTGLPTAYSVLEVIVDSTFRHRLRHLLSPWVLIILNGVKTVLEVYMTAPNATV